MKDLLESAPDYMAAGFDVDWMDGFANWMRFSVRLPRRLALPVGRLDAESEVLVLGKASRKLEIVALTLHPL